MTAPAPAAEGSSTSIFRKSTTNRITSIDALRGLVMFTMIFVNDLAGAPHELTPDWMVHFSDRHKGGSGMTFVDLVFPAFLFIVGMSIPFALGSRLAKGESLPKIILHIFSRTLALLSIGILMVNESPSSQTMGWSATVWSVLMYLSAILAFCTLAPGIGGGKKDVWKTVTLVLRVIGFVGLIWLAFAWRGKTDDDRIIRLAPFTINRDWYGILGLIGWAYLASAIIYLIFRGNRTALLGCVVLMTCSYAANRKGFFNNFWLHDHIVDFGETLGSQAGITVAGLLLASILVSTDRRTHSSRVNFTLLFVAGFAAAAILLNRVYGISKNNATPSWCLWASAITAALWLIFYWACDVVSAGWVAKPLAIAGQNVLLAYLISEMLPSLFSLLHIGGWYGRIAEVNLGLAIGRSIGCALLILAMTALLNRAGLRLRL